MPLNVGTRLGHYSLEKLVDYLARPNPPMPSCDADTGARRRLAIYLLETY